MVEVDTGVVAQVAGIAAAVEAAAEIGVDTAVVVEADTAVEIVVDTVAAITPVAAIGNFPTIIHYARKGIVRRGRWVRCRTGCGRSRYCFSGSSFFYDSRTSG